METIEDFLAGIIGLLFGIAFIVILVWMSEESKKDYAINKCDREVGHGISYKDKELCLLEKISNK